MASSLTGPLRAVTANTQAATSQATTSTGSSTGTGTSTSTGSSGAAASEGTFLQLLVSQLQNQDPLNPMDSTTFVTQLAQFSQLETLFGVKGDLDSLDTAAGQTPTPTQTFSDGN
jgi:flagellar basal-body rod modification protein FlgD